MKSLPSSLVLKKLASLESLCISDYEELMSLEFMNILQNLLTLSITGCPKLVHIATTIVMTCLTLVIDTPEIDAPFYYSQNYSEGSPRSDARASKIAVI